MKGASLPCPCFLGVTLGQAIFPIRYPTLNRNARVSQAAKEMDVVGHEQIVTDQPSGRIGEPDRVQKFHDRVLGQPFGARLEHTVTQRIVGWSGLTRTPLAGVWRLGRAFI